MNVLTDQQLADEKHDAFRVGAGIGFCVAIGVGAAAYYWQLHGADLAMPANGPEIVKQTPSQTVARIPTLRAGKRVDCTVTIDQAKNAWLITC